MKKSFQLLPVILLMVAVMVSCSQDKRSEMEALKITDTPRTTLLFDFDWQFYRGDTEGAEDPLFDDTNWRSLDLPHDWSIEDIPGTESPIDSTAIGGIDAGYTVGGTGWYRKTFFVPDELEGKIFYIQFDGIYMNADIWINGEHLGNHPYGYTSFWYDITDALHYGTENVIAVEVKNEGENSRWYSGSGIYRHVWLNILDQVHIAQWGTYIATPEVNNQTASVNIKTKVNNYAGLSQDVTLVTVLLDPDGTEVARISAGQSVEPGSSVEYINDLEVSSPKRWSIETPELYTALSEVYTGEVTDHSSPVDRYETIFGIRSITYNAEQGFLLNGEAILLKGGCMHHDNGPLGSAAYDRAEERRVELMKASGFNSIRCAHNPPSPGFLDACDRLGVLVIDESFDMWRYLKNPQDYHLYFDEWWQKDLESMLLCDRNHPSIIMWSIGNEIPERAEPEGVELAAIQAQYVREHDPTRPVTSAVNGVAPDKDPFFAELDIAGYNYSVDNYVSDHKRVPDRIIYGAESFPLEAFEYWMSVLDHTWVIGDFVWTGFDYLGEASIGWMGYPHDGSFYPWLHAFCGDIDICGFKRPQSFYRDVLWMEYQASIFVHPPVPSFEMTNPNLRDWSKWNWYDVVADWNWAGHEGDVMKIDVYSSCPEIELFLDGESFGRKKSGRDNEFTVSWDVPYQPGVLKAVGYQGNQEIVISELRSAGEPASVVLSADRTEIEANGQDLSYVVVELVDENGIRNPKAENLVEFEIEGPGTIAAVGSSNPFGLESFRLPKRKACQGRCLVIIKAGKVAGDILLRASSEGLEHAEVVIKTSGTL
jgi:beta-galactosidase